MTDKEKDDMVKAYVDNMPDMVLNSNGIMNWRVFFNEVAKKVAGAAYKDGINAAQKQMIDKACEWLEKHNNYICGGTNGVSWYNMQQLVKDFKKAMEE